MEKTCDIIVQLKGELVIVPDAIGYCWDRAKGYVSVIVMHGDDSHDVYFNLSEVVYIAWADDVSTERDTYIPTL